MLVDCLPLCKSHDQGSPAIGKTIDTLEVIARKCQKLFKPYVHEQIPENTSSATTCRQIR